MDIQQIINKYKESDHKTLMILSDNREVIGHEVDGENHLYYVIKDNQGYSIELALNLQVIKIFPQDTSTETTINLF